MHLHMLHVKEIEGIILYDLIVLKSVCTVIQEYCRRKYCVLISYDLKWEEWTMIMQKK